MKKILLILHLAILAFIIFYVNNMTKTKEIPISEQLINFLKEKEGFRKNIYKCSSNALTIGYGHRINKNDDVIYTTISKEQAEYLLIQDIGRVHKEIFKVYSDFVFLDQNKQDALTSLVFNWGIGNFAKSKLLKNLKQHKYQEAANEFLDIVKSKGKVLEGLVKRRKEEANLFLNGE